MKVIIPPIKSQGIKTKLVPWIKENTRDLSFQRWVEPFMGTGAVAFNIAPQNALLCDSNPHIIAFYQALQSKTITSSIVRDFLEKEGMKLLSSNGEHYYVVRERFNLTGDSLDFLFLSRSCFNGMMRFNKKGAFNVPFCKKPNRFSKALITKITNQVSNISEIIDLGNYEFRCQDFKDTLSELKLGDFVYLDPPYLGRNIDYFDSWDESDELMLHKKLLSSNNHFILSTWLRNKYRVNNNVFSLWKSCSISTKEHFYHVGGREENRNAVYEALLSNIKLKDSISNSDMNSWIYSNKNILTGS